MHVINNVGVYSDSDTCLYHLQNLKNYNLSSQNFFIGEENLSNFKLSKIKNKIAAFHVPFYLDQAWFQRITETLSIANKIFVYCSELHQHTVEQLISLDHPNVCMFVCGFINHNFKHATVNLWMDWFVTTVYFYKQIKPNLLLEKLVKEKKSKYFDILLGCRRHHRDFVHKFIQDAALNDKVIMTYYQRWNVDLRKTDHIFETEGLEFLPESTYNHSVHKVHYYGHKMNLSQIVPIEIYNHSYYSLVAETNAVNYWNFYTEKIVKPILAKRLFVVIAGQGYLRNLKRLGFKTFDNVIDESYDDELNDSKRWAMALDQIKFLTNQNTELIQSKIKSIVDHNQSLILEHDWYNDMIDHLIQDIVDIVDR